MFSSSNLRLKIATVNFIQNFIIGSVLQKQCNQVCVFVSCPRCSLVMPNFCHYLVWNQNFIVVPLLWTLIAKIMATNLMNKIWPMPKFSWLLYGEPNRIKRPYLVPWRAMGALYFQHSVAITGDKIRWPPWCPTQSRSWKIRLWSHCRTRAVTD